MAISNQLKKKLDNLITFFKKRKVIIAFSGGIDSSLLAFLSKQYAEKTLLVIGSSVLFSDKEIREALEFAERNDISYLTIELDPLENEFFVNNPPNRCYLCKKMLYSEILNIKEQNEFDVIVDGTNVSELDEHRPGYKVIEELNISAPYVDFDIDKKDIRALSKYYDLSVQSKPASACFATRIEYGLPVNKQILHKIKSAEQFLKDEFDLTQLRVRYHQGYLVRIEFLKNDLFNICNEKNFQTIKKKFKSLGFRYITLDIEGFESGSMNRNLDT